MKIHLPNPITLSEYYKGYLKYITEEDLLDALTQQKDNTYRFLKSIPAEKESYRYQEGKWMLKEVVGHICDTERTLAYRALRFSRTDTTALNSFDENLYVPNSNHANLGLQLILEEKKSISDSSIHLFKNMTEEMIDRLGTASTLSVSVRALLFFIVAHERHHINVISEKYL